MIVSVLAVIGGPRDRYRLIRYDPIAPVTPCCADMAGQWDLVILLGCPLPGRPEGIRVCMVTDITVASGDATTAVVPIRYCPWCAGAIEVTTAAVTEMGEPVRLSSTRAPVEPPVDPPGTDIHF